MSRPALSTTTLCAVTSVNVQATIAAMRASLAQADFAEAVLLTDARSYQACDGIRVVPIHPLRSAADYSHFILTQLVDHISTEHCLIVQWDGFVINGSQWRPSFLEYDYIGAPWPQFTDGHDVGNGGFSLRSAALLRACADRRFKAGHPEDIAIGRANRFLLEKEFGIRFPDAVTASRFSHERSPPTRTTFGFHGVFNMIPALGPDRFWRIYRSLDDRTTTFADLRLLTKQIGAGADPWSRRMKLVSDRLKAFGAG